MNLCGSMSGSMDIMNEDKMITAATVHQIHKVLRSCFRQAVKWEMMDKNPAIDATLPKYKAEEREIWTAEMLMQAIDACENKWLKVAFHLAFAATVRIGELLGLTWDCVDVSEEAIAENRAYIFINKQVERVSRNAVDELYAKEVILIFPSQRKNNKTVRLLKTPKTDTSERKVYIPKFLAQILVDIKKEQDLVSQADHLIFVYPNWHDSEITIVKGYKEKVFAKKFAYQDGANGLEGLLKDKSYFTIMNCGYLGGGRGYIGDGVGIEDEKWDTYMNAFKVFDDDTSAFWGTTNYGRIVNDRTPANESENYGEEIEQLRSDLNAFLDKVYFN